MAAPSSLTRPVEDRRLLGIGLVLVAVGLFSVLDTTGKYLVMSGINPMQVALLRYLVTLIIVSAAFVPKHGKALFETHDIKLEIVRGVCLTLVSLLNFIALIYLPLTVTGAILFTMPLLLTALSVPFLGENVGWRRWAAIIVGFCGVLIIIRPGSAAFHPAVLLSLAGAALFAFYNIINRKLAGVDSVHTQQFYTAIVAIACLLPLTIAVWSWPENAFGWMLLLAVGLLGTVGHFLVTMAYRFAPASILAPFFYPQIIYMTFLSWLVFDQGADIYVLLGATIVVGAGLYVWLRERKSALAAAKAPASLP